MARRKRKSESPNWEQVWEDRLESKIDVDELNQATSVKDYLNEVFETTDSRGRSWSQQQASLIKGIQKTNVYDSLVKIKDAKNIAELPEFTSAQKKAQEFLSFKTEEFVNEAIRQLDTETEDDLDDLDRIQSDVEALPIIPKKRTIIRRKISRKRTRVEKVTLRQQRALSLTQEDIDFAGIKSRGRLKRQFDLTDAQADELASKFNLR